MSPLRRGYSFDDLDHFAALAERQAEALDADFFPQIFEVCDTEQMYGYMAYGGMSSHYRHWSFGKQHEIQKTLHRKGIVGLPYEMVINSDPSLAYLMRNNTLALQILTIAHVYFHNNFFKNNVLFRDTRPELVLGMMKTASSIVDELIDDPLVGIDKVEQVLDAAHALALHDIFNRSLKRETQEEQKARIKRQFKKPVDSHRKIHPALETPDEEARTAALLKVPLEPDANILACIRDHSARLEEWEQTLITLALEHAEYFAPQIQTKAMNEGHACTGHKLILDSLDEKGLLPEGVYEEFMIHHNRVIRPHPRGGINPYHIGFKTFEAMRMWYDGSCDPALLREERDREFFKEMKRDFEKRDAVPPDTGDVTGLQKQYEIRDVDRDTSFFRAYLTLPVMRRMRLFVHEAKDRNGGDGSRRITHVVNEDNWEYVRDMLIAGTGESAFPTVKVEDARHKGKNIFFLRHYPDRGRELHAHYAEQTLKHVVFLTKCPATLECRLNDTLFHLTCDDKGEKVQTKMVKK